MWIVGAVTAAGLVCAFGLARRADLPRPDAVPQCGVEPADYLYIPIQSMVAFAENGGRRLFMDVARPVEGRGPFPAVICIHGGGWKIGHRITHHRTIRMLAAHGYVAATIDYRLAPEHRFPAQLEDARSAVRFLRANAATYGLDPDRIGALGDSAGGHLALLLGVAGEGSGQSVAQTFLSVVQSTVGSQQSAVGGSGQWSVAGGQEDPIQNPKSKIQNPQSPPVPDRPSASAGPRSDVRVVVNYYGISDLSTLRAAPLVELLARRRFGWSSDALLGELLGTADRASQNVRMASPIHHVSAGDAPVLSIHGLLDPLVPAEQSVRLHQALTRHGVENRLVLMPDNGHGWNGAARARTDAMAVEFLDRHLK